jgi:hypothetical protein
MPFLRLLLLAALAASSCSVLAGLTLASRGDAKCVIVTQAGATEPERYAAEELADHLVKITGASFLTIDGEPSADRPAIIVGQGSVAAKLFPEVDFDRLGMEGVVMKLKGNKLLLAGGRPRGTLYAVYRFLYEQCGVRWWTPWAMTIPIRRNLSIGALDAVEQPAFESRDPYWCAAFDGDWSARNYRNGENARREAKHGGAVRYLGFVHTFSGLVPPDKYFAKHPEWFALIDGKRNSGYVQLCTTNPELRDFMVEQVRNRLREDPTVDILSVSQNDTYAACQCPVCKAMDEAEGSPAGTMLNLVNYVAAKIASEFPHVAIDTLAYQYTRHAPKVAKPLPNVIVRLCSIECNFDEPLTGASNTSFATDIVDWGKICNRIYIWDYTTNFANYVQPHPNWFVEGPNIRFFHDHGAKGLFEEGAYESNGSEMAELRAWVEAQLMWNPYQDDKKLIQEFLDGYYGKPAARYIRQYMDLLAAKAQGYYMGCYSGPDAPFLSFETLSNAELLWQRAEQAAKRTPELEFRVKIGHLPVYYVWLSRWTDLRRECLKAGAKWPVDNSRKAVADTFAQLCDAPGPIGWKGVTALREGGLSPKDFVAQFQVDPADPVIPQLPPRKTNVGPPPGLATVNPAECIDVQDNLAHLVRDGEWAEMRGDPGASDGIAIWMPNTHHEWAFQVPFSAMPAKANKGKWNVYAVVRVVKDPDATGTVFSAGVYDPASGKDLAEVEVSAADAVAGYKAYLIGTVSASPEGYVWVAPAEAKGAKEIWVDRLYLVPAK